MSAAAHPRPPTGGASDLERLALLRAEIRRVAARLAELKRERRDLARRVVRGGRRGLPPLHLRAAVLNRLLRVRGAIVPIGELVDAAYGNQPDGGATWAATGIRYAVAALRRRGWPIESCKGRGYRLAGAPHE